MDKSFYFDVLYPFQDDIIQVIHALETGFYLTGGTASSRAYLQHRFSDDLDFFVNDASQFTLWCERVIQALQQSARWRCQV